MGRTATKSNAKLKIHLESDQLVMYGSSTESSGCVLRGAVSLRLKKPTSFKSMILSFYGTISVSWNQWNGYERKYSDQKILINHKWAFLPLQAHNKHHQLEAGYHSYEFELVLPGTLPESTHVAKYYLVQYQLKAVAERSSFLLPNYTARQNIHLSRQKLSLSTDYLDPVTVANHWADKLDYEITLPTKVYSHGDTIPVSIQALPLAPNLQVRYISCTFKEYMTCRAINGWFNGKNKSHGRIIHYTRRDQDQQQQQQQQSLWSTVMHIKVPESLMDIQCDAHNDSVRVRHKLKFTMSIENEDGHISELRAVLPVVIAITNSIGGLPAYEETWRTMPYDPALMMALIRRSTESTTIGNQIAHLMAQRRYYDIIPRNSGLPSYSSITTVAAAAAVVAADSSNSSDDEDDESQQGYRQQRYSSRSLPSYDDLY
ncbi:hypothetical protein MBANPS3_006355 [Mucor bainieri]